MPNSQKDDKNQNKKKGKKELLSPKTDYVFKRIFGRKGNEEITKHFVNSIIKEKVESISLDVNPILSKDYADDKYGVVDILTKVNNTMPVHIEMQIINNHNIEERIEFYSCSLFCSSIKSGENFSSMPKVISIIILDYDLDYTNYYHSILHTAIDNSNIVLTDKKEVHIIELPKFRKHIQEKGKINSLESWLCFIDNPENMEVTKMNEEEQKALQEALKILDDISSSDEERELARLRMKKILDYASDMEGSKKEGIAEGEIIGEKKGRIEGERKGRIKEKMEVAKAMLKDGVPIDTIINYTHLTREEIENLKK